jgi:hypothetical protein
MLSPSWKIGDYPSAMVGLEIEDGYTFAEEGFFEKPSKLFSALEMRRRTLHGEGCRLAAASIMSVISSL